MIPFLDLAHRQDSQIGVVEDSREGVPLDSKTVESKSLGTKEGDVTSA